MIVCRSLFNRSDVRRFEGDACPAGYGPAVGFISDPAVFSPVSLALVFFAMLIIKRAVDG